MVDEILGNVMCARPCTYNDDPFASHIFNLSCCFVMDRVVELAVKQVAARELGYKGDRGKHACREYKVRRFVGLLLRAVDGSVYGVRTGAYIPIDAGDGSVGDYVEAHDGAVVLDPISKGVTLEPFGPVGGKLKEGKVVSIDGCV